MKKRMNRHVAVGAMLLVGAFLFSPLAADAQVKGQCADCHTMHNSQGGTSVVGSGPYGMLLTGDCIGCHSTTGTSGRGGSSNNIPYVNHTSVDPSLAPGGMLAGGSFRWVKTEDAKGHSVLGIADTQTLMTPPGFNNTGGYDVAQRLTCAGTNGCHGDRTKTGDYAALSGAHHAAPKAANKASGYMDGTDMANSYRFLSGIKGMESADWESLQALASRNVYSGVHRTDDTTNNAATISSLCGQCHGDFHAKANGISANSGMSSPWVRHPTDFDMAVKFRGTTKEYATYAYSMEAPVASANISNTYARPAAADILSADGDAIVTCISCHRAHGSNHADLLRWDYAGMKAHDGTAAAGGCFHCHTTKDDA